MKVVAQFRILNSFKITGRGLVALGDLLEGRVKIGNYITFHTGTEKVTLKIGGVEMADNVSTKEFWVGLTFVYKDETERKEFESLKLSEQIVEIMEE